MGSPRQAVIFFALVSGGALAGAAGAQSGNPASDRVESSRVAAGYEPIAARLSTRIRYELIDKGIPGLVIAVQDGDQLVWEAGFGTATPGRGAAMPRDGVLRCASISKLFTAVIVHQLAAEGRVDLDRPVRELLDGFRPNNPFDEPVTLRHILGHRSGIVREPPVGHYFDVTEPGLAEMVGSLAATSLVTKPGTAYAYSNAALGVAGRVVEVVEGKPFAGVVAERICEPLGMAQSRFDPWTRDDIAGAMWTYDRRAVPCPTFDFAYGPAANLQAPMADLMRFARSLFRGERQSGPQLLPAEVLRAMWQPGAGSNCGQGFRVDHRLETLRVAHGGAVYGFATMFYALPDEGLAVAVGCTLDMSNAVAAAIADRTLELLLARRAGEEVAAAPRPKAVGVEAAQAMAGTFVSGDEHVRLQARGDELYAVPSMGTRWRIRAQGQRLVSDGPLSMGAAVAGAGWNGSDKNTLELRGKTWRRQPTGEKPPPEPPLELVPLLGEYGWDHNRMIVFEDRGELAVLIEWLVFCPLARTDDPCVFRMHPRSMYAGEAVGFERTDGEVSAAIVGGCRFPRITSHEPDDSFRIDPRHDAASLRRMAAQARAPRPPRDALDADLVELRQLDPTLRYDIRYASDNNFMGMPFYEVARAKLQRPAALALIAAHRELRERHGLGMVIYDGYRPWSVTKMFFDATPDAQRMYVANPEQGSRHNRGCAIDLGLYDVESGEVVPMLSGYDEFTAKASPDYPGSTGRRRWHRDLLRRVMEDHGFEVYEHEWWHFDFRDWQRYPVLDEALK